MARLSAQLPSLRRLRLARNRLRRLGPGFSPNGDPVLSHLVLHVEMRGVERLGDLLKLQLLDVAENLLGPTPGAAPWKYEGQAWDVKYSRGSLSDTAAAFKSETCKTISHW